MTTSVAPMQVRQTLANWLLACCFALLAGQGWAQSASGPTPAATDGIGRVVIASGQVEADGANRGTRTLREGDVIYEGDVLRTDAGSRTQITFMDGARLAVRPASRIAIEAYRYGDAGRSEQVAFRLERGGFRTATGRIGRGNRTAYRFSTPQAVIGVRGTDWGAQLVEGDDEDGELQVGVNDGGITLTNDAGSIDLGDGAEFAFAVVDDPTTPPLGQTAPPSGLQLILGDDLPDAPADDSGSDSGDATSAEQASEGEDDGEAADSAEASDSDTADGADGSADDGDTLVDLGGTTDEESDVVFEYGDRCF